MSSALPPALPLCHPRQYNEPVRSAVHSPSPQSNDNFERASSRSHSHSRRPHPPTVVELQSEAYEHLGIGEMEAEGDQSFLPRIVGIFFATFDPAQTGGAKVTYQVPANLISTTTNSPLPPPPPPQPTRSLPTSRSASRARSTSAHPSPLPSSSSSSLLPPPPPLLSSSLQPLLSFAPIADFVVPQDPLCNQLVTITSGPYKIQSFPVIMTSERYKRNNFRWNVCWVFERWKYEGGEFEQVVRKVARVLRACEAESALLSSPESSHKIPQILEQLFEDLNSYAETSIPIDKSNSIEIKIFPLLPNPPKVEDWNVPLPLIDLAKMREPNWDLTMDKVVKYIDGVRHVKKIAECADATSTFTRICIEHLLYYQGAMLLDIFQYANMYTVMPALQYLSEASHVMDECAPYSMRNSRLPYPSWPTLLRLYTHLRPGLTVSEWMLRYNVVSLGIDVRRFVSFGVIKGFLRRVHRWPIWRKLEDWELQQLELEEEEQARYGTGGTGTPEGGGGGGEFGGTTPGESGFSNRSIRTTASSNNSFPAYLHHDPHHYTSQSSYSFPSQGSPPNSSNTYSNQNQPTTAVHGLGHHHQQQPTSSRQTTNTTTTNSILPLTTSTKPINVVPSPLLPNAHPSRSATDREKQTTTNTSNKYPPPAGPRYPWGDREFPPSLTVEMLDGEMCSDALCVRFQVGWEGERGLERALRRFARCKGGVLELVYR